MEGLAVVLVNVRAARPLAGLTSLPVILAIPIYFEERIVILNLELRMLFFLEPERIVPFLIFTFLDVQLFLV